MTTPASSVRVGARDPLAGLMVRVQHGDQAAFAELYDATQVRVGCIVQRTLRAPDQAVEVLQEVFLYAWEHARSYDADLGTVLGWLAMVARRRAIDRVRAVTRSIVRDDRASRDPSNAVVPDVADLGVARHEAMRLRAALHLLSTKQREAVALTYLGGYTHQEAATLLCVPLGTLKTRVREGVAKLRDQLDALPV